MALNGGSHSDRPMGWATQPIKQLQHGETVQFRPRGNSMTGKIESGQLCTVEPIDDANSLQVGDIVVCKVNGNQYIHLIKSIQGKRFQIGNNRGRINGWITANSIFGKCVKVEP
jgi:SOS-response transcriptional repressor LexA